MTPEASATDLLHEIDQKQNELLAELDELNQRIEALLAQQQGRAAAEPDAPAAAAS